MSQNSTTRLHSLDALRSAALLLGVVFHAAFSFIPGDVFWIIKDTQESPSISALAFTLHIFRMTVFFVLAGYFGRLLANRLGTWRFVRDRVKRIGVPLLIFWPVMMTSFIGLAIWAMLVSNGGVMPDNTPPPPSLTLATFPLTHLWFLYMLGLLYIGMLLLRGLIHIVDRNQRLATVSDRILSNIGWLPLLPVALALPIAYLLLQLPVWHPYFGIPTPEYGFVPNTVALYTYGSAFTLGWLLQRRSDLLGSVTRLWIPYLGAACALTVYCISIMGTTLNYVPNLTGSVKLSYAIAYALAIWFWVFGLIGLCSKIWATESPARRYLADASYWIYLVHLPIVMALHVAVSQWTLAAELKFLAILAISIPGMLLSYEYLVRYTFMGRLLNGRKRTRVTKQLMEQSA